MSVAAVATVSFTLAKLVIRVLGHEVAADMTVDAEPTARMLLRLRERRAARSISRDAERGIAGVEARAIADHDRRAALMSVDQVLRKIGDDLAVQRLVSDDVWPWVLGHGGRAHKASLGGDSGDYFERVLRHCLDELATTSKGAGFAIAADKYLVREVDSLKQKLEELNRSTGTALDLIRTNRPQREAQLARILASAASYRRELAMPEGQYVARTLESGLFDGIIGGSHPWPRVIVGEAGAGKSTLLWALEGALDRAGFDPILTSAAWLLAQPGRVDDVAGAAALVQAAGTPILLVDTVDLMLHQEDQRQTLLALMEQMQIAGIPAVYTTRPQERPLVHHPDLRVTELGPYDEREMHDATRALAWRYCPDILAEAVVHDVATSVARGLPAADVCRSPLLLRMLFETAGRSGPEFADLDVTALYGDYWERRVERDARSDGAVRIRPRCEDDLSAVAGTTAAALLVLGLPREMERRVRAITGWIERETGDAHVDAEGLERLRERGVLDETPDAVSFFHQTMFEYAFARWWIAHPESDVLESLVERAMAGHGDLFVGAALEQTLVLAAREFGQDARIIAACERLTSDDRGSVQGIGLAAWAQRPWVLRPALQMLARCDEAALARTARLLPSGGGRVVGDVVSQLLLLWEATDKFSPKVAVLRALARVALNDSGTVAQALEHLYPSGAVSLEPGADEQPSDVEPEGVRLARAVTGPPADELVEAFVDVFEALAAEHATVVRRLCVTLLGGNDGAREVIFTFLVDQWQALGDGVLLREVLRAVGYPDVLPRHLENCGRVVAEEYLREAGGNSARIDVAALVENRVDGYGSAIDVFALAVVAQKVEDAQLEPLVRRLLVYGSELPAATHMGVQSLLSSRSEAVEIVAHMARDALEELREGRLTDAGACILDYLAGYQQPGSLYRAAFTPVSVNAWWMIPRLRAALVPAAADGVASAREALGVLADHPERLSAHEAEEVLRGVATSVTGSDAVVEQVLRLALFHHADDAIARILDDRALTQERWDAVHRRALQEQSGMLPGGGDQEGVASLLEHVLLHRAEFVAWADTRRALEGADEQLRVGVLTRLWQRKESPEVNRERIAYLRGIVALDPGADVPVGRATKDVPVRALSSAAKSLLNIVGLEFPADVGNWDVVRTLTLYQPLHSEQFVLGTGLAVACKYLQNVNVEDGATMPGLLLDLLDGLRGATFVGIDPGLWQRELVNAINHAVEIGGAEVALAVARVSPQVDTDVAEVLLTSLADRWFRVVRETLIDFSHSLPDQKLRALCQSLVRDKDRSAGTRSFPELVPRQAEMLGEFLRQR